MIIFKTVRQCDFTGQDFDNPVEGIAYIAQGATGRWCEVMHGGPKELERLLEAGEEILNVATARQLIKESGDGWSDF